MSDVVPAVPVQLSEVEALYRTQVSSFLNEAIVRTIRDAYRHAPGLSKTLYGADQAREVMPRMRRAALESELLKLTEFEDVRADSLRSSASSYYVQLEVGDFVLIAARAQDPTKMVRKALYRAKIATRSRQGELFGEAPVEPEARYYALILHGSAKGQVDPAFITVRFPTSDHQRYLDVQIDLRAEHTYLFNDDTTMNEIDARGAAATPVEQIQDLPALRLRQATAVGSAGE